VTPEQYIAAIAKVTGALALTITPAIRALFRSGLGSTRKTRVARITPSLVDAVRAAREAIAEITEEWMRAQAKSQVHILNPVIPEPAGYSDEAVRTVLNAAIDKQLADPRPRSMVADEVVSTFERHAQQAGRQMVEDAVEPIEGAPEVTVEEKERADKEPPEGPPVPPKQPEKKTRASDRRRPVAWARGLTGAENCAFCIMLASRGAVYKSKDTAKRSWEGEKYHDKCDCIAIPVYTSKDWPGKDQADLMYQFWLTSTRGHYQQDAINAFRRALYARQQAGDSLYPGFKNTNPKK
jgi:hypothetical protein